MSKEGTVAPKERVNITYRPATGNAQEQIELPLKFLMLADLTGQPDARPVEDRAPISVDKDNFARVMAEQRLCVEAMVPDRLGDEPGAELSVRLDVQTLSDFGPDGIASQVPALKRLLVLRSALIALKGPMGNVPAFRRKIQNLLADEQAREQLASELGRDQS
jgi:type VI secretion system protein ImpB